MVKVLLSNSELFQGASAGIMRRLLAMRCNRKDRYGQPPADLWGNDIESACAELAVAKATGSYWQAVAADPSKLPGDVGPLQVRWTPRTDGCLILHEPDPDDARFYLVTGRAPALTIVGWIWCGDGKRKQWWSRGDGRPAFFVPQKALKPLSDLEAATTKKEEPRHA